MTQVVVVGVDGTIKTESWGGSLLPFLQEVVGGFVETIGVPSLTDPRKEAMTMWINEEGTLMSLPTNAIATDILVAVYPGVALQRIAGEVVLTGPPDGVGRTTSVSLEEVQDYLLLRR